MSGRDFVLSVIEEYRKHPCLWQVTNDDYHNKDKRNTALKNLLLLFKAIDKNANLDTVKKKISSMRNCFKKEHNKVKASSKSGVGANEIHTPKLWYYNEMLFLADVDTPRKSTSVHSVSILDDMPFEGDDNEINDQDEPIVDNMRAPTSIDNATPSPASSSQSGSRLSTNATKRSAKNQADALLLKISKKMDEPQQPPSAKLKYDAYGQHIAEKLRNMPQMMATYCQKIINDAIFMAETDNLTITSHIVRSQTATEAPPLLRPPQELRKIQNYFVVSPPAPEQEETDENDSQDTSILYRAYLNAVEDGETSQF